MYHITNYVAKVPPYSYSTSILRGLVNRLTTSREINGQQIALDLIRKGEETWVSTTYIFAHGPLYQFLRMVTNAAGSDASGNTTDAQRVGKDGAAAVDNERELEQEDDKNDDERITFENRPITDKVTISDHYMHRPSELKSISLYDFVWCCRVEPIKPTTNRSQQSVPDNNADNGNMPRAKRGRHAEPRYKFRGTHAAVGKLVVAMRAAKVVPVPLLNKQVSQSSDIGSTESRAMISMILFKTFRAINKVAPARGETWSQTLDLFKSTLEQGSDRLRWINNFRDYVDTSPGKLVDDSEADNSATPKQVDLRRAGGTGMGNDDEADGEIMPVGIAQEAHGKDAFLHEILSIISQNDQHAAMLLMSAQLLKVDSDPAWFAQLANYADLARKADEDARRHLALNLFKQTVVSHRQPSGVATLMCGIGTIVSATKPMSDKAKAELEASFRPVKFVLIDEISMVDAKLFAAMHLRFDALYPSRDHRPFGGLHVLAFGDFFQFELVMARSLTVPSEQPVKRAPEPEVDAAHDGDLMQVDGEPQQQQQQQQKKRASKRKERPAVSRTPTDANIGRDQWLASDSVFFHVQQMRQSGDASFLNVLQDLRNCIVSQRVIEYLGSRRADVVLGQHPGQLNDWSDQVLITAQNSVRDAWNLMAAAKHARRLDLQPNEIFDLECVDLVRKPSTTGPLLWRQLVVKSSGQGDSDWRMLDLAKLLPSSKTDHIPSTRL
ncbi:hypothetical protein H9P43_000064 [Blastocladiella emersonii ATCC 22665]|nr:hypothetical protein H9P43_000064 [Blastocladiella emersonii ATCC 22665]